jgi:hypothetical protein
MDLRILNPISASPSKSVGQFYAFRAQATSVSQGRPNPRRLRGSASANAPFRFWSPALDSRVLHEGALPEGALPHQRGGEASGEFDEG